jgi:DNA repair photolyase
MKQLDVIYQPAGRAREYSPWALNLYQGCGHGCLYCYAPKVLQIKDRSSFNHAVPRPNILDRMLKDCIELRKQELHYKVLLCFTCDPYQPINDVYQLTRQAIEMLHFHGQNVIILTKGGYRANTDLHLLQTGDEFAVTLTCTLDGHSLAWEPLAALPAERIDTLKEAHSRGIFTWVSLEPVLYPQQSLDLIRMTHTFVDKYKLGTLNYHPKAQTINWKQYGDEAVSLLGSLHKDYYIKDDLKAKL